MKILIVDDNRQNLELLEAILTGGGHTTVSAGNGIEALEKLRKEHIDMIISDILMPGMDGFKLRMRCREDEKLGAIPFIFTTSSYTEAKDEEFGISLGAAAFIVWPMETETFLKKIETLFEARKGRPSAAPLELGKNDIGFLEKYGERLASRLEHKVAELEKEVAERRRVEEELKKHRDHLEELVAARTRDLDRVRADLFAAAKLTAMGRMGAGLAHQLNAPLGGTTRLVDGLIEKCGKEHEAPLKEIRTELGRMHDIIERMLTLAMLPRRGAEVRTQVELPEAIGTMLDLAEHDCAAHAIRVERILPAGLPTIIARPGEIDQIFANLVNNAIDAMPQGGTLTVEARAAVDAVEVRVADTGEGIPGENLDKIFEPFFTTRRARHGVGLGLSIVHEIVECYGGTIRVESEVQKGTTVTVRIPTAGLPDDELPSIG